MLWRVMFVVLVAAVLPTSSLAQDVKLEVADSSAPEVVSAEIQQTIGHVSHSVLVDGQAVARFWFRKDPKTSSSPSTELGVTFGQLESGSLLGVVELLQPWADYKNNSIQPGVYTMRYGIMPADGNHMGVSPYRDYMILIPANTDTDPDDSFSYIELVSGSVQASGVPHPAVLALYPIWDEVSGPTLTKNEMDQWTLAIKLGEQIVGLVVVGHGEV